jgi:mannose-6-phosphate isomerase-like protein (cupin superfamily)
MPDTPSPTPINLRDKAALLTAPWSPRVVAELNDYQFKVARVQGEFVWHDHADTDEAFLVLEGTLEIDLPVGTVTLEQGDLYVVPRGVRHRPRARSEATILLVEPRGIVNTGAEGGSLTAPVDAWI